MPVDYLPRTSLEASHHTAVDNELKSLKLLSRRIQSATTAHQAELQILRRLFYKNKNQHRGALFWRSISEVRRYAEKLQELEVSNTMNTFRKTFHGEANSFASKGPWTHFPSNETMLDFVKHCDIVLKLSEKTSAICLNAYSMFHRSMQSGAFLQVLLMFVAITSRMRLISMELVEILTSVKSCIIRLRGVAVVTESVCHVERNSTTELAGVFSPVGEVIHMTQNLPFGIAVADDLDTPRIIVDPCEIPNFDAENWRTGSKPPIVTTSTVTEATTIIRVISESKRKKLQAGSESQRDNAMAVTPKKKKRKVATDEIDDIFGFKLTASSIVQP